MKLEKREITLNEKDSLKDVFYLEKTLLSEYGETLLKAERTETQRVLLQLMRETAEEMLFIKDLLESCQISG